MLRQLFGLVVGFHEEVNRRAGKGGGQSAPQAVITTAEDMGRVVAGAALAPKLEGLKQALPGIWAPMRAPRSQQDEAAIVAASVAEALAAPAELVEEVREDLLRRAALIAAFQPTRPRRLFEAQGVEEYYHSLAHRRRVCPAGCEAGWASASPAEQQALFRVHADAKRVATRAAGGSDAHGVLAAESAVRRYLAE